jgi:hypothetical protein
MLVINTSREGPYLVRTDMAPHATLLRGLARRLSEVESSTHRAGLLLRVSRSRDFGSI